ncbi:MAG: DUF4301 family protein, partial [Prolixibacteraceae bacterium]|nr:DUF4301 family protein [Prolixibacteraceae bacterium]
MFSEKDELQIKNRGSELQTVLNRIENFKKGFPFLQIEEAASIGDGIIKLDEKALEKSCALYDKKVADGIKPLKFVPASGAASRMFKALFEALEECKKSDSPEEELINDKVVKQFIDQIENFAFYNDLKNSIQKEKVEENCKNRVDYLLNEKGLNYGSLPKGLLKFHRYKTGERTPFEEHLVEGAEYSKDNQGVVQLHFTVSPDHQPVFENLLNEIKEKYEKDLNVSFEVSFSQQKPSTDTIAVDLKNEPFRELDGRLLFRPGGHGSLIENLNDL